MGLLKPTMRTIMADGRGPILTKGGEPHPMGEEGLAWADYKVPAADPGHPCSTCSFYGAGTVGQCGMFDTQVEGEGGCREWYQGVFPTPDDPMPYRVVTEEDYPYGVRCSECNNVIPVGAGIHDRDLGPNLTEPICDACHVAVLAGLEVPEGTKGPLVAVPPRDAHNRVLVAGYKRVDDELIPRLARLLEPELNRIADEAATNFERMATNHLTAAAPWSAPAPDEIINMKQVVAGLRTKTDPVRLATVQSVMGPTLKAAGIDFDATNPLTAKVLAQSGSQVTNIAETTQLNVMRAINHAHAEGLSIPDTAKAIRAGMREASPARATLIARTELVGAVNGGSLAAARIVSEADQAQGGQELYKQWLTSPGAQYPRHETYEGLDGQTVRMEDTFDVGDDQLEYPGDPAGSPEEVCNCRCALAYTDDASQLSDTSGGAAGVDTSEPAPEEEAAAATEDTGGFYSGPESAVPKMTEDEAVAYYYTPKSFAMNAALRDGEQLTAEQEGVRRALDASFKPAEKDMVLYRGVTDAKTVFGSAKPAEKSAIQDKGYMSVSASSTYADDFASGAAAGDDHPVIMRIIVPKGTPILEVPPGEYNYEGSKEFLLPRGMNIQVNSFEGRSVTAMDIDEGAKTPIVNTSVAAPPPPVVPPVGAPEYVKGLQAEQTSLGNKIANIQWYINKGQEKPFHAGRMQALQERLTDVKNLLYAVQDQGVDVIETERATVAKGLAEARGALQDMPKDAYWKEKLKLLEARAAELEKYRTPPPLPPGLTPEEQYASFMRQEIDALQKELDATDNPDLQGMYRGQITLLKDNLANGNPDLTKIRGSLERDLDFAQTRMLDRPGDPYWQEMTRTLTRQKEALDRITKPLPPTEAELNAKLEDRLRNDILPKLESRLRLRASEKTPVGDLQAYAVKDEIKRLKALLDEADLHVGTRRNGINIHVFKEDLMGRLEEAYKNQERQSVNPPAVERAAILEWQRKLVDELLPPEVEPEVEAAKVVNHDDYVASLKKERDSAGNKIANLVWKEKNKPDTFTESDRARLNALRQHQANLKNLLGSGATVSQERELIEAELKNVRPGGDYADQPVAPHYVKLLEDRLAQLDALAAAPAEKVVFTSDLARDLAQIKATAVWPTKEQITSARLKGDASFVTTNGTAVFERKQQEAVLAAGKRLQQEIQVDPKLEQMYRIAKDEYEAARAGKEPENLVSAARRANEASKQYELIRQRILRRYAEEHGARDFYELTGSQQEAAIRAVDADPAVKAAYLERSAANRELADLRSNWFNAKHNAETNMKMIGNEYMTARREKLLQALSQVREMGGGAAPSEQIRFASVGQALNGVRKATGLLTDAQRFFPRDWIRSWRPIQPGMANRGLHTNMHSFAKIQISEYDKGLVTTDAQGLSTSIHELGHEVEDVNPDVVRLEHTFYEWRTRGGSWDGPQEELVKLSKLHPGSGYAANEVTREDKFTTPYMGKDYGGRNYELLTMGLEDIWNGAYANDEEYQQFILGILAIT